MDPRPAAPESFLVGAGPPRRFRRRVFFYLLTLSLATSTISGATYYTRQVKFIERDRGRRAGTLLSSLATQAELGAYAGDAALCELPARSTFKEEDVVYVGVYDPTGKEILRLAAPSVSLPAPPLAALAPLLHDADARPLKLRGDGYDDLWAPIVTTARPAAVALSSEPGGAAAAREVVGLARIGLSLTPAQEQLDEVLRAGVYLTVGLLMLGALAALLIAGKISDPILALARGADEIRAGNLDVTIPITGEDELGVLADSFNKMAAELRETMAKLAALNRNLEGEVERRTDEIRRSAEFTEALNAPIARHPSERHLPTDQDRRASGDKPPSGGHDVVARGPGAASEHRELDDLLSHALGSLAAGTQTRAAAILLAWEEAVEFELQVAATRGADARAFGAMPSQADLASGRAIVETNRAVIPILFRGQPEGAIVLVDDQISMHAVEFAKRAAGQLAIAISNARAYAALQHLAKELKDRNAALVKQRDQLQEMNRLKSEFLANTSHELRTPLNAILGYTELLAEGVYGTTSSEQREALSGIDETSRTLLTLINQILDLSKVESGKMEVYLTEVAMHDIAQAVAAEAQAFTKGRLIIRVVAPSRIVIKTDHNKVQQIVSNLVANAVKFTEKGSVTITVATELGGGCKVAVRDTGIGISKDQQQLIFEEFRQIDGSPTRKYAGTGLGLAIARRFAILLSGSITVESEPGKGSTFTLHLPAEPRPAVKPPPLPSRVAVAAPGAKEAAVHPSAKGRPAS